MPIYRYRNLTTNETFDLEQRITESALTQHPETGDPVKRLIQPVGIAFKGSGFYVNDSRASKSASAKDNTKDGAKGDKAETKTEGGKTDTSKADSSKADSSSKKSENKSATKTESKSSAT